MTPPTRRIFNVLSSRCTDQYKRRRRENFPCCGTRWPTYGAWPSLTAHSIRLRPIELGSLRLDHDTHIVALHCRTRACTCSELLWDRIEKRPLERRVCDSKFKRFLLYTISLALLRLPGAVDSVLGAAVPRWHRAVLSGYEVAMNNAKQVPS